MLEHAGSQAPGAPGLRLKCHAMTTHLLALETSSSVCGVALLRAEGANVDVRVLRHDATAEHAERLLPMVDQLLQEAGIARGDLHAVAFGQGPGGFTGLRVACGVAQGMAFALQIPVLPVGSLAAVATRARQQATTEAALYVVVQDARMREVYLAAYAYDHDEAAARLCEVQAPILLGVDDVSAWMRDGAAGWTARSDGAQQLCLVGDAAQAYPELTASLAGFDIVQGPSLKPDAETIARLALAAWRQGKGILPDLAAPLYVRDKVAYTISERENGSGGNPRAGEFQIALVAMAEEHLDDVAAIEQSVQSFPWSRGNFADGLQAGYGSWVARQAGRTVGFCMAMFAPDVVHVLVIAVAPASQKQGIGALLLNQCEQIALAQGLTSMVLEVRPSNENALQFYRGQGFELLAVRKDYYPAAHGKREDACVMHKKLAASAGAVS